MIEVLMVLGDVGLTRGYASVRICDHHCHWRSCGILGGIEGREQNMWISQNMIKGDVVRK